MDGVYSVVNITREYFLAARYSYYDKDKYLYFQISLLFYYDLLKIITYRYVDI